MPKKKERRLWPWQKKPVPPPPPPHPDDYTREFYEAPHVARRHRLRWTDQPRSGAAREGEDTLANYVRQDSIKYKSHKLIQQMEEDAVRNAKLDADRAHMFDPTVPRPQRGSYLDFELRVRPPPKVSQADPIINPVPRPRPIRDNPRFNANIVRVIHTSLKLYKDMYTKGTKEYKEMYFMTKQKLLEKIEEEVDKRPSQRVDAEGYAPSVVVSQERIDVPGKPRGIMVRVDRWTKYKRRIMPPRAPRNRTMPAYSLNTRRFTPELFYNEDMSIIKEKLILRGRRHPKKFYYKKFWWGAKPYKSYNRVNRKRILEFTFGDGFGLRLIVHVRPCSNNNYVMQCVSQTLFGVPYFGCWIRRQTIKYVCDNWDIYGAAAARSLMYCCEWYKTYDPKSKDVRHHMKARWMYAHAFNSRQFDCKLVELQAACRLYKINLCVLEMMADGRWYFRRAHTTHKRFIYFMAQQELDATRLYCDHYITWLKMYHDPFPYIKTPQKYYVTNCQMMITYHIPLLYFWRFTEVEPSYYDPPPVKKHEHHWYLRRNRKVRFSQWVDVLHYHEERPAMWWQKILRYFGYCKVNYGPDPPKKLPNMSRQAMFSEYMKRWKKLHKKSRYREKTPEQRQYYLHRVEEYITNARKVTSEQVFEQQNQPGMKKWEKSIRKVTNINRLASEFRTDALARALAEEANQYRVQRKLDRRARREGRKRDADRTESNCTF